MILKGEKYYLRPITIEDTTDRYVDWLNDKEVNQYLESRFVLATKENVKKFVEQIISSGNSYFFAICENGSHQHIGNIKLGPVNLHHNRADVGILIGEKSFWGKGAGSEAITLITSYAFDVLGLRKVNAGCYGNNLGSEKAFLKSGYIREGFFKDHCISEGGIVVDAIYLAKINPKYL